MYLFKKNSEHKVIIPTQCDNSEHVLKLGTSIKNSGSYFAKY